MSDHKALSYFYSIEATSTFLSHPRKSHVFPDAPFLSDSIKLPFYIFNFQAKTCWLHVCARLVANESGYDICVSCTSTALLVNKLLDSVRRIDP